MPREREERGRRDREERSERGGEREEKGSRNRRDRSDGNEREERGRNRDNREEREERGRGREERSERSNRDRGNDRRRNNEGLKRQMEEISERKEMSFSSIIDPELDVQEWYCKSQDEQHIIDVIPYLATENHPQCKPNGKIRVDDLVFVAEYWVHKRIGSSNAQVVCPAKTFPNSRLRCPICERRTELAEKYGWDDKEAKKLKPIHFGLYNVVVYDDTKEEAKGVQVWSVQWHYFGKPIRDRAKNPRSGGLVFFADPDQGKSVSFYKTGTENVEFSGHQFLDRDYDISDEILDQAYVIEDLVKVLSYDEIKEIFIGSESKEDDDDDRGESRSRSRRNKDDDDDDDRGESRSRSRRNKGDDDDDDDDGRESVRDRKKKKADTCEFDGEFGVDIDNLDECQECEVYDKCAAEYDRLQEEKDNKKDKDKNKDKKEEKKNSASRLRR